MNTRFADGQTIVGFGSSDILVRRVWVLSPTRLLANVSVAPTAPPFTNTQVSILTGFQMFNAGVRLPDPARQPAPADHHPAAGECFARPRRAFIRARR